MVQAFEDMAVKIKGMNGEEKAEDLGFMFEHEVLGVGGV